MGTPAKPERNSHPVSKSSTPAETELCLASSLVVDELINQCSKPDEPTINSESSETAGQRSEVSPKIQSSIHTEEETINILVNHLLFDEMPLQVKRSVLLQLEEPVESEVPELLTTKKKNNLIIFCSFFKNLLFGKILSLKNFRFELKF